MSKKGGGSPRGRAAGGRGGAAPREMTSGGISSSWTSAVANHVKVGDAFLMYISGQDEERGARWGTKWEEVPEEQACTQELFGFLATYLAETHRISEGNKNAGQLFDQSTADAAWGGLIQNVKKRFGKSVKPSTTVRTLRLPLHACSTLCFAVCIAVQAVLCE